MDDLFETVSTLNERAAELKTCQGVKRIDFSILDKPTPKRTTQHDKILKLLESKVNQWIPLPEILKLGCAQYNTRVLELRRQEYKIENKTEWIDGRRCSWFRLCR